jgi:deoxyribodipyrimidine photolyase-related protein
LISPQEVIEAVLHAARDRKHQISLAQVEGFVRQILGWREFMRGIYWAHMPQYADLNFFEHYRPLPQWYWNAQTHMNCMQHAIRQSLHYAYAHHIQRLMLTGNFALLAGVNPTETDAWYLGIYIDAREWVEITNTRGMSQYADGGLLATKPYVCSANYIDNMSNYCKSCFYNVKRKSGDKACPFNSLYWHFFHRHRERLQSNPRVGMMYKIWDAINTEEQNTILQQAEHYLNNIEHL